MNASLPVGGNKKYIKLSFLTFRYKLHVVRLFRMGVRLNEIKVEKKNETYREHIC